MSTALTLQRLHRWREAGWLRSLDLALALLIHELDPDAPPSLLLASALLAQLEARGHGALPVAQLPAQAPALLAWPAEAADELAQAWADWPVDLRALHQAWAARPVLEIEPTDDLGASPLVLAGPLLLLRRYWRHESRIAAHVRARTRATGAALPPDVDAPGVRELLQRLFAPAAGTPSASHAPATDPATDWQQVACALALRGRLTLITGGPGTGKTHTAARLLVLLQALHRGPQPLRVALAAPTGKAAARLRQSIGKALHGLRETWGDAQALDTWAAQLAPARTLHALLGVPPGTRRFRHDAADPLEVDLLFVDEASMVHLEMMDRLLQALPPEARVVLLGDKDQLASVEAGAVMGELCQGADEGGTAGGYRPDTAEWIRRLSGQALPPQALGEGPPLAQQTVVLRHSRRFGGAIGQLALAVNRGDADAALALLGERADGVVALAPLREAGAMLPLALHGRAGAPGGYLAYLQLLQQRPADAAGHDDWARQVLRGFDRFRVLCVLRDGPWGVAGLNAAIEQALAEQGGLQRRGEWYEGRPVMVTRNDAALGVFNGDVGVVLRAPGADAALRACFLDGDTLRTVAVSRLADVETAFAMTVHKSQGSEFEHVLLVLPEDDAPVLTRELLYTGITRASQALTLATRHGKLLAAATARLTRRVSGLRAMLVEDRR